MTIIILLISISLLIAVGFLLSFLWNMKSGQYDDTYSPSVRMLFEDSVTEKTDKKNSHHGNPTETRNAAKKI